MSAKDIPSSPNPGSDLKPPAVAPDSEPSDSSAASRVAGPHLDASNVQPPSETTPAPHGHKNHGWKLALGALGIVYGDIGTSPLYAFRECFDQISATEAHTLGIVSCVFWALVLVVGIKYAAFVLRADNGGEGGVLALMALTARRMGRQRIPRTLLLIGLFGTALFYADGMLTPAISVLSAVEGLAVRYEGFHAYAMPVAIVILFLLFAVQKRGTAGIGALFGPVTMVWFLFIAGIAIPWVVQHPEVFRALNPSYAFDLLTSSWKGYLVLGSVVLTVTGAEAMFADLGHFGKAPIRKAWFYVAFPALFLSYAGQGAYVLEHLELPVGNPFYEMAPDVLFLPLVVIATAATVVASQALISGVFSVTHQGIQLGYLPRLTVVHTSSDLEGQVYVPQANWLLALACIGLVLFFRESGNLASAYGIAVTGTMLVTTVLFFESMRHRWGFWKTGLLTLGFVALDLVLIVANIPKIPSGGWIPLATGLFILVLMLVWIDGSDAVKRRLKEMSVPLEELKTELQRCNCIRIPGTAVFLTRNDLGAPPMLVHHVRHSHALHQNVVLLTVDTLHVPTVPRAQRMDFEVRKNGFVRVTARYGFRESPDLRELLSELEARGLPIDAAKADIFVGHSTIVPTGTRGFARWRGRIYQMLQRNSRPATTFFQLPSDQVEEVGVRLEI